MIFFFIPGEPTSKLRSRSTKSGKHYTPEKTVRYESTVALFGSQAMGAKSPILEPLSMDLVIYVPIPQSWSKKKQERALKNEIRPAKKPDLDNLIKSVCDGLNAVVYGDDSQIVECSVKKYYGINPGVEVKITEV